MEVNSIDWVLLGFTVFHWVSLVLIKVNCIYGVLLGFNEFE